MRMPAPKESEEQQALFTWAALHKGKYPELELLYHIPNGGYRSKAEAGRFKAQGVKPGVPDLCLPVARGGYHGLYIELKRIEGGQTEDSQKVWIAALAKQGYHVTVCRGWIEAANVLRWYLQQPKSKEGLA